VTAAIDALTRTPTTAEDRRQFQRTFGGMYVLEASNGGSCCAPRG
jgi:hypothetical protein